jgi:hypothetical protein
MRRHFVLIKALAAGKYLKLFWIMLYFLQIYDLIGLFLRAYFKEKQ